MVFTEELLKKIKKAIEKEVYITPDKERIYPEASTWLMDFRRVFLQAEVLDAYAELFYERFSSEWPFQVGGAEVAAIPLVTAIGIKMREKGKPVNTFFVRKSRKKIGLLKMVEGKITNDPVIFVDDLINRGNTFERQILVADEAHVSVRAVFVALRFRDMEYYEYFHNKRIRVESLFMLDDFTNSIGVRNKDTDDKKHTPIVFDVLWRFQSPNPKLEWVQPKSGVAIDDQRLYFGTDRGIMWALNKLDGDIFWNKQIGLWNTGTEIFSTPIVKKNRLYFGARDGNIYCLDSATGKREWISFEADWIIGALLLLPKHGLLIVPAQFGLLHKPGGIVALDSETGKKVWECRLPGSVTGSPMYSSVFDYILVGSLEGTVWAIDRKEGRVCWSFKTNGAIHEAVELSQDSQCVVVSSMDGAIYCLEAKSGLLRWKQEIGVANYASPIIWRNKVYIASLDKNLYCLNLESGKQNWSFMTRARIFSSPKIVQEHLYLGTNEARLYELNPETGRETGYFQVTERITNPIYYDEKTNLYYLVTYANEVYCLRKK